jgi:hypothetical protein
MLMPSRLEAAPTKPGIDVDQILFNLKIKISRVWLSPNPADF